MVWSAYICCTLSMFQRFGNKYLNGSMPMIPAVLLLVMLVPTTILYLCVLISVGVSEQVLEGTL